MPRCLKNQLDEDIPALFEICEVMDYFSGHYIVSLKFKDVWRTDIFDAYVEMF